MPELAGPLLSRLYILFIQKQHVYQQEPNTACVHITEEEGRKWRAEFSGELIYLDGKTRLGKTRHRGPLRVQRPFYPEGDSCAHLYLLHPPGGLVAGDHLNISLTLHQGSHALITTPSAGKVYNNITDLKQSQCVGLTLGPESVLEWLPQETLVFDGAYGELVTDIYLEESSSLIAWEITCLGRPESEDWFLSGSVHQKLSLTRNGIPLLKENSFIEAQSLLTKSRAGLGNFPVFATMVFCGVDTHPELPDEIKLKEITTRAEPGIFSVTRKNDVLIARYLGPCADQAKRIFTELWRLKRPHYIGRETVIPGIWNT